MYKSEYPRPNQQRDSYLSLNGVWDFEFDDKNIGLKEKWNNLKCLNKKIVVPFAFQTKLSTVNDQSFHDYIWYHRTFEIPSNFTKNIFINFQAVDYECIVFINGVEVIKHLGGGTKFRVDITNFIHEDRSLSNDLTLYVYDPSTDETISRGKQAWKLEPDSIWYDRTSGIYQSVWLESIDINGVKDLKISPNIDLGEVTFEVFSFSNDEKTINIKILDDDNIIVNNSYDTMNNLKTTIKIWEDSIFKTNLHNYGKTWSPENPHLYDCIISISSNSIEVDRIKSYFGMRKVSVENGYFCLNNRPYYLKMVLNQGYFKDSLLTAPSDSLLREDIIIAKRLGFNGCRIHQKVEEERFIYHADKLGFLTSLELPSAQVFSKSKALLDEWIDITQRDYNHPSLIMYVPFNESWGIGEINTSLEEQNYVNSFYYLTKSLDPTRPCITNDGWEQTLGDLTTIHKYDHGEFNDTVKNKEFLDSMSTKENIINSMPARRNLYVGKYNYEGQPILLSEFGGLSYCVNANDGWGYTNTTSKEEFVSELERIFDNIHNSKSIVGFCYTQLTDCMQEKNGLVDSDRVEKVEYKIIEKILIKVDFDIIIKDNKKTIIKKKI